MADSRAEHYCLLERVTDRVRRQNFGVRWGCLLGFLPVSFCHSACSPGLQIKQERLLISRQIRGKSPRPSAISAANLMLPDDSAGAAIDALQTATVDLP